MRVPLILALVLVAVLPCGAARAQAPTPPAAPTPSTTTPAAAPAPATSAAPTAPQAIPAKAGFKYFRLQQGGDLWDQVVQAKALAIHMPSDLPSTKLELVATTE